MFIFFAILSLVSAVPGNFLKVYDKKIFTPFLKKGDQFRVHSLPGLPVMPSFGVYSGYITVNFFFSKKKFKF